MHEVYVWGINGEGTSTMPVVSSTLETATFLMQSEFGRDLLAGDKVCIKHENGARTMYLVCQCTTGFMTTEENAQYGICASCFQKRDTFEQLALSCNERSYHAWDGPTGAMADTQPQCSLCGKWY